MNDSRHGGFVIPKPIIWTAQVWFVVFASTMVVADIANPQMKITSDYHTSFYVAGLLMAQGKAAMLYPPAGAVTFQNAPFDLMVKQLFAGLPPSLIGMYMYSPLVALMFAPLSLLAPHYGLLLFQALNIFAIAVCARTLGALFPGVARPFLWMSFLFMPVVATLWIGQLGVVLGLLPLVLGYRALREGKLLFAGLWWSLLWLKPQIFPAAAVASFALLFVGNRKTLLGLMAGALGSTALMVAAAGPEVFMRWLASLPISETLLSGALMQSPPYLVACLPGAILSQFPGPDRIALKPYVYAGGMLLLVATLVCSWLISKNANLDSTAKRDALLSAAILALPIYSPRLLLYDLAIYLLPLTILLCSELKSRCSKFCEWFFVVPSLYVLGIIFLSGRINPLLLAVPLLSLVALLYWRLCKSAPDQTRTS